MMATETIERIQTRMAYRVAVLRAQHQLVEGGSIFRDPFAVPIAGESEEKLVSDARKAPQIAALRQFCAARSRFAEDCLAAAVDRGVRQVVVMGAGLDTLGLRNPHADKGLRVFEVDRPVTQDWKQQCIDRAGIHVPDALAFVPVDFEKQAFLEVLASAGFKTREPAFFIWLGVVQYLSRRAIASTLSAITKLPDAEIVFDYVIPKESLPPKQRAHYQLMIAIAEKWSEPWITFFKPPEMKAGLTRLGFLDIEDLGPEAIGARYFRKGRPLVGHIVRARKPAANPSSTG